MSQLPPGYGAGGYQPPGQGYPYGGQPSYGQQPYGQSPHGQPPKKRGMSAGAIIGIVLGALGVLTLVCCGTCGGLFYWDMTSTTDEMADKLRNEPVIREHIGEVESFSVNVMATGDVEEDVTIYDIKGTRGSGQVKVSWDVDDEFEVVIHQATLEMEDGNTYEVFEELSDW